MIVNNELQNQDLYDIQYCHSFELNAMADLLIRRGTERWVSGFSDVLVEKEHTNRYKWICEFVNNKRVLDIACGTGAGSYKMADAGNAREIIGCDLDVNAVSYAKIRYKHPRISFLSADAQQFKTDTKFDIIVSFETIEHLPDVDAFLKRIVDSLTKDGYFFVSTPISKKALDTNPVNKYHIQEWGFEEFNDLISKYLTVEATYLQMRRQDHPSLIFQLKKWLFNLFDGKNLKIIKNKYLENDALMSPIKYEKEDKKLFSNDYDIVGYQILKCKIKTT